MRSICPPGACICGARNGVELKTPIQIIGPQQIVQLTAGQVLELFRESGVNINLGNRSLSVMQPGVCRRVRSYTIGILTEAAQPENDPNQQDCY